MFKVIAHHIGDKNIDHQSVKLNDKYYTKTYITHKNIQKENK
jgi:hypothetical protein